MPSAFRSPIFAAALPNWSLSSSTPSKLPAVAELVTDMHIDLQAARAITYETSRICDHENNNLRVLEWKEVDAKEKKARKKKSRELKRLNSMLTPLSKYYASEMCCRVADRTIQVLGGSGYVNEHPVEMMYRDNRLNPIHEGTTGIQSLDLVGRKLGMRAGGVVTELLDECDAFADDAAALEGMKTFADSVHEAVATARAATEHLVATAHGGAS